MTTLSKHKGEGTLPILHLNDFCQYFQINDEMTFVNRQSFVLFMSMIQRLGCKIYDQVK